MVKGAMNVLYGGQAGSESKGKLGAYLVDKFGIQTVAGNFSPNAGHTVIKDGKKVVTHHIPASVAGIRHPEAGRVILGPASVINPALFREEVEALAKDVGIARGGIMVDGNAALIDTHHINSELNTMTVIGSTAQGVGEARVDRMMRRGRMVKDEIEGEMEMGVNIQGCVGEWLMRYMRAWDETVLYEMSQGFDLCLFHGVDPIYCTSRNCTSMQAYADMGIPLSYAGDSYAVIRPYPIRVNNRSGSSGPYPSPEITWEEVGRRCGAPHDIAEITTTTKLRRRVFEFSMGQIKRMVEVNEPTYLCLQFANYIDWNVYGMRQKEDLSEPVMRFIGEVEVATGVKVAYVGTGPDHLDMVDMGIDKLVEK